MRFRDVAYGDLFVYWNSEKHIVCVKTDDREACCLVDGEFYRIHPNKKVQPPSEISPGEFALDTSGRTMIARQQGSHYLCQYFLCIDSDILPKSAVSIVPTGKGDVKELKEEVNIMLNRLGTIIGQAQTLVKSMKVILDSGK